ncbi:MAG TPA: CBS domain-containing protein [Candidatus Limnocylindrales bacterium]|nr:CBS domain-containing protein [Candidatus Limnocylindrales bacterium]
MICPVCQWQNFEGDDLCDNCGADLRASDTPEPATGFRGPLLGLHLDELGAPPPQVVDASEDVAELIERMHRDGIDCLLVTDGGRLAGIFTDRDALVKLAGRGLEHRPIRELMTPDPVILRRDDTIAVAINKMAVGGFRHIPVMDGGRATAVVSARDIFRHIATRLG